MAATWSLKWELSGSAGGLAIGAGSLAVPVTYTSSADEFFSRRTPCTEDTTTTVYSNDGVNGEPSSATLIMLVPNVDGAFAWRSTGAAADNSTALGWRAGIPLIFSTGKSFPYQSTTSNRVDETAAAIDTVYFRPSDDDGYVEVLAVK